MMKMLDLYGDAMQDCYRIRAVIRGQFTLRLFRTDICPGSIDAVAVESLGSGVITGAANDDPSGIATCSVAGARLGNQASLNCTPGMAPDGRAGVAPCLLCRLPISLPSRRTLAGYPRPTFWTPAVLLHQPNNNLS